ncbi:MAG: phospholipase D-like domain-containing protein [Myxococcota bacterium]
MRALSFLLLVACSRGPAALDTGPEVPPVLPEPIPPTEPAPPWVPPEVGPTRLVCDRDYLPAAILAVQAASERIRVAEFLVYEGSGVNDLLTALEAAAERGVEVRFLADEEGDGTEAAFGRLASAGIDTRFDGPARTLHNKLVVADDVAVVGSHNLTSSALNTNHEGSVLVADAEVAGWYAAWFDAVWDAPDLDPELAPLDRADLLPVADRGVNGALLNCLDDATSAVDVVMYAVSWNAAYPGSEVDQVLTALEAAAERGVAVRVVLDGSAWVVDNGINSAALDRLELAGIPVWTAPSATTTHAKVLRCDDTVIVSDANWSYSGLALMHGTSLVVRDPTVVADTVVWMDGIRAESVRVDGP